MRVFRARCCRKSRSEELTEGPSQQEHAPQPCLLQLSQRPENDDRRGCSAGLGPPSRRVVLSSFYRRIYILVLRGHGLGHPVREGHRRRDRAERATARAAAPPESVNMLRAAAIAQRRVLKVSLPLVGLRSEADPDFPRLAAGKLACGDQMGNHPDRPAQSDWLASAVGAKARTGRVPRRRPSSTRFVLVGWPQARPVDPMCSPSSARNAGVPGRSLPGRTGERRLP